MSEEVDKKAESTPEDSASVVKRAVEQRDRSREVTETILKRTDVAAKTLATLGTTGLTAIGIAKVSDIFPLGGSDRAFWVGMVIGGFLLMGGAFFLFLSRLWHAQEPIVMGTDTGQIAELTGRERPIVDKIYARVASINGVEDMRAYEARGLRLSAVAKRTGDSKAAAKLQTEADQIGAEVQATEARARLVVARRRAAHAIVGGLSALSLLLFLVGLLAFGIGADKLDARRSGEIDLATKCAKARALDELVDEALPSLCESQSDPAEAKDDPTVVQKAADGVVSLTTAYADCLKTAEQSGTSTEGCEPLRRASVAALAAP